MAIRIKKGWVHDKADIAQTGQFQVVFNKSDSEGAIPEPVTYVSPYGSEHGAFVAIPEPGSVVLVMEDDDPTSPNSITGYHYLGSIMGPTNFTNINVPLPDAEDVEVPKEYLNKDTPGIKGPAEAFPSMMDKSTHGTFPVRFKGMYDAKGVVPEAIGLTNHRGDVFAMQSRYNSTTRAQNAFQDYSIGIMSGNGKRIQAIDSPIVDGIVMSNEHRGKDFFIWSTGLSPESPFAEGEWHMRTHGPVNMYTLMNRFHIWVEDGLNIEIENKSTPSKTYGPGVNFGPNDGGQGLTTNEGPYSGRQGDFGNETTGCIQLISHWNNISASALAPDSVIHVHAPGDQAKVIVETGGTVDIVANKKITLQSGTEVEINAPLVDINGTNLVTVTSNTVDIDGSNTVDIDGGTITLN